MFAMKSERENCLQWKWKEKNVKEQNVCNEKGKKKLFTLKEGTIKCSKWKGKE
jgi:hypothetical protein